MKTMGRLKDRLFLLGVPQSAFIGIGTPFPENQQTQTCRK